MKRKIVASVLTICMIVTMMPAMAFASTDTTARTPAAPADPVKPLSLTLQDLTSENATKEGPSAEMNGIKYDSIQSAINKASVGDTIKLLKNTNESIIINKPIILNLNKKILYTDNANNTITINCSHLLYDPWEVVKIKNGTVVNYNPSPTDIMTAIYVKDALPDTATISNVHATMAGAGLNDYQGAVMYVTAHSYIDFVNSEISFNPEITTKDDHIDGIYIARKGSVKMTNCTIKTLGGDCCYINGYATMHKCYFVATGDDTSAIHIGELADPLNEYADETWITSGYYYGNPALYAEKPDASWCNISEGEFVSAYKGEPVVGGNNEAFTDNQFTEFAIMSSPSNWKEADHAFLYRCINAPKTVNVNLTAAKGQKAGFDDIKVTWTPPKNTKADGYRVNYKKGTGTYGNPKFYKVTTSGSRIVTNLADGYKCTFKVTPFTWINEDILKKGTRVFSSKSKTAYAYTLKKVTLNKFTRSKGKVKVAWKNINGETGYQISRALKKNGTNIVYTYKTTTGKSKLIKATKGKNYWYKVRAYKIVNGKKIFGPWSAPKKFKR